ncbi:hypothetical protein PCG10_005069 [Penicillium crustosum]|uniref:Myb-like DNA-binding domain-containing protein n=1 Tax=Penicillium crustosum TaxID=36656 RepID=A0A9P5L8P9_PENCR|nr:uncharacterized protein N7487_006812 [Penicillium crustosum]KAF7530093.1 hypothetical protein PCG10_005069 [Penicillium crustosum]KAJ5412453.1 hypothetical protein N7487_006812 [Penicillium crustosum]
MASNKITKAKAPKKKNVPKSATKPRKLASDTSREILEERLEFVITCIKETGIKVDMAAVARHYKISTNAANLRLRRANDYVAKMVSAREEAQKSDETQSDNEPQKDNEDLEITEDED